MAGRVILPILLLLLLFSSAFATHFRSGLITWKPVNPTTIEISQRFSWRESFFTAILCDGTPTSVAHQGPLNCRQGCTGSMGSTAIYCTDYSPTEDWFTGTRTYNYTFASPSVTFQSSFRDCCWISTLVIGSDGGWEVRVKGSTAMRPDGFINSSPVTSSTPILRLQHGCHYVLRIPVADPDGDNVRCRWAQRRLGECADVCNAFPNAMLDEESCTITYTANGQIGAYAVALQVEDFISVNSTTPLSSVPLQFLVYVSVSDQPCAAKPVLVAPTPPDESCIAVPLGDTAHKFSLVAYSPNVSITDFETISPRGLQHTGLTRSSYNTSLYYVNITWTPTLDQFGLNIFCFSAENTARVTSDQSCITLVVGITGPRVLLSSITPIGFVAPSPTTVWQIEFDQPIRKPRVSRRINIFEKDTVDKLVMHVDSDTAVYPSPGSNGTVVTFTVNYNFEIGKQYYVLMDAGFAVGEQFCNQESLEIYNQTFWTLEIPGIKLFPRFGNSLGGTGILINPGIELYETDVIQCIFAGKTTVGRIIDNSSAVCVSPFLQNTNGFVDFKLNIKERRSFDAKFLLISPEVGHAITVDSEDDTPLITNGKSIDLSWDPNSLIPSGLDGNITVDISYQLMYYDLLNGEYTFQPTQSILKEIANDGQEKITINSPGVFCFYYSLQYEFFTVCPIFIKISVSEGQYLPSDISIWSGALFLQGQINRETASSQCNNWYKNPQPIVNLQRLPDCPPNEFVASFDLNFVKEDLASSVTTQREYHELFMNFFHHGIKECYRQSNPSGNGFGQQCCYGNDSVLVKGSPSGGTTDSSSPLSNYYAHVMRDLLPHVICCKINNFVPCKNYYYARPSGNETNYRFPRPASALGDPHIVTLDGLKYTFNGKGEFTLIQTEGNIFTLQGRMEQILDNNGNFSPGTVFTAIVVNQLSPDATVQFEVVKSDGSLRALVNSEEVTFGDIDSLKFEGVALLKKTDNSFLAWFSNGAYVEVRVMNSIIEVLMVGLPESMKRKTRGLMGSFNDIISDDLLPKGGRRTIPTDSSLKTIHNDFGITWIIDKASDSLFTYRSGENHGIFYFPNFSPMFGAMFTNSTLEEEAKEICGDDVFCLFDIAATGRVEIGVATMEEVQMIETVDEMTKPIICAPACVNGVCTEGNACSCNVGFTGDRCNEAIIEECPENFCQNNGVCSKQGPSYTCTCTSEFTGTFCQDRVPPLTINMINSSPHVLGNEVVVRFTTNKIANVKCYFDGVPSDCNNGSITYRDVSPGKHILRIVATITNERALIRRRIYIGDCAVHLINDGISINEGQVAVQFSGTREADLFHCHMDRSEPTPCSSPLRYDNLAAGRHTLLIEQRGCVGYKKGRLNLKFKV